MKEAKRKRGRPPIGKIRDFRMSNEEFERFIQFCKSINRIPSEVIRELLQRYYVFGIVTILDLKTLEELKGVEKEK